MTPTIVTIREGVQFTPPAADSFRRAEHGWQEQTGRLIDVNSTYRDPVLQMSMHLAWQAWVNGTGPKPWHSRAVHPKYSIHCQGNALDSDDWTTPGFITWMAEHGFIRTAASDPTEQHHFEYQWWRDQHRDDPVPSSASTPPALPEGDLMSLRIIDSPFYRAAGYRVIHNGHAATSVQAGLVQDMILKGGVDYCPYDADNLLEFEVQMVWQLGGLSASDAAAKTAKMLEEAKRE